MQSRRKVTRQEGPHCNHPTHPPSPTVTVDNLSIDDLRLRAMANRPELMPGTLDMLILKTLTRAPLHGYGIAQSIKRVSDDVLRVEEGSLYPALQRLLLQGWVKAEWKKTETNRRARYYTLTAAGRKQLGIEVSEFQKMIAAIGQVLEDAQESV
jgi:PadR family transcriptional regulator, regulatory protein PadR